MKTFFSFSLNKLERFSLASLENLFSPSLNKLEHFSLTKTPPPGLIFASGTLLGQAGKHKTKPERLAMEKHFS